MSDYVGLEPVGFNTPLYNAQNLADVQNKPQALINLGAASSDDVLKAANPIGTIIAYYGTTAPYGYLPCSGQTVSSSTFPDLVTFLGGTTSATLPDMRGEFLRGWDNGRGIDVGRAIRTWQVDMLAQHGHGIKMVGTTATSGSQQNAPNSTGAVDTSTIVTTGGIETRPRNVSVLYCIKAYAATTSTGVLNISSLANEIAGRPTPPQFDNSLAVATTAFVQNNGLRASSFYTVTTNTALTSVNAGQTIGLSSTSALAVTLPSVLVCPSGSRIEFMNFGSNTVSLSRVSTDLIWVNSLTVTQFTFQPGDTLTLESRGDYWFAVGGSLQTQYATSRLSNFTTGWKRYSDSTSPTGYITEQWGTSGSVTYGSSVSVTFPVAYATGILTVSAVAVGSATNTAAGGLGVARTTSGLTLYNWGSTVAYSSGIYWRVTGY